MVSRHLTTVQGSNSNKVNSCIPGLYYERIGDLSGSAWASPFLLVNGGSSRSESIVTQARQRPLLRTVAT